MHLNLQTDYALRILMALASTERQMSVDEIARSYAISRNHLAKIAQRLQALDLVTATRGRSGGLNLARPPAEINVGKVVRTLESLGSFVDCMSRDAPGCPVSGPCGLKGVLASALEDFLSRLDRYSLADLVPNRARFARQLSRQIEAAPTS